MSSFNSYQNKEFHITLDPIDDGHTPGGTSIGTQIATYHNKANSKFLSVFDGVLPDLWCDRLYEYALQKGKPWGSYVLTQDALDSSVDPEKMWEANEKEKALALISVRSFFFDKCASILSDDFANIDGVAIWCLASRENEEVQYHIDYAELYRYETNIIYPPIYGGTLHVAPITCHEDMRGGEFNANIRGIDHYRQFGYKGRLSSKESLEKDFTNSNWLSIPYQRNRGIVFDGDFPHYAAKITHIQPHLKRVILGLNCFPKELHECCSRAPEHSDAFNRTIKLYQKMAALGIPITAAPIEAKYASDNTTNTSSTTSSSSTECAQEATNKPLKKKSGLSIEEVKKNPMLAKLLIKAANSLKEKQAKESST